MGPHLLLEGELILMLGERPLARRALQPRLRWQKIRCQRGWRNWKSSLDHHLLVQKAGHCGEKAEGLLRAMHHYCWTRRVTTMRRGPLPHSALHSDC